MNNTFRSALAALALVGATLGLHAEVALKVATVDMDQLFTKYYKTDAQQTKLRDQEKRAREAIDNMGKDLESLVNQAKDLQEQSKNAILSEDARKKALSDLEAKVGEIRAKETDRQGYAQQAQAQLQKQMSQYQQLAFEEIAKVAGEIAKKKGATLLLNQGSVPVVIYADSSFSITDDVLAEINKDAPPPAVNVTVPATAPAK